MRYFFLISFFYITSFSKAQTFYTYRDTVNHFSIDIPIGWKYGTNKNFPSIKLAAVYQPRDSTDTIRDNFNVNIFDTHATNTGQAFASALKAMQSTNNFKLIDTGSIIIKQKEYKWLIESHENQFAKLSMHNYAFVINKNQKTCILTFVSRSNNFLNSKELFYRIATSFDLKE